MKDDDQITCNIQSLPFRMSLSFEHLISELESLSLSPDHPMHSLIVHVLKKIEEIPELRKNIKDENILEHHQPVLQQLMAFVINPLNSSDYVAAATAPFAIQPFYSSNKYKQLFDNKHSRLELAKKIDHDGIDKNLISKIYHAYLTILEKVYNYPLNMETPFTFRLINSETKQTRFLKKNFNTRYLKVKTKKKFRKISKEEIKVLINNIGNLDLWNEKIPLNEFEFSGFVFFHFEDVTHDYVVSQLKSNLLNKDSILTKDGFTKIRDKIRALTDNPYLEFGMAVTPDKEEDMAANFVWNTIIPRNKLKCSDYTGTFYEEAFMENKIVLTDDFTKLPQDKVVTTFIENQLKCHAVVPLSIDGEMVGMLEFATKEAGAINMLQIKRMHELFPTFAIALKRSKEEWNDKLLSLIQEEFTAIHPTVEWRFREAANLQLKSRSNNEPSVIDPIIFSEVIPIYGASDIRSSSLERNYAIQSDLTEQLQHAHDILTIAGNIKEMPLLADLRFKISLHLSTVKSGLKAGDEVLILEFLKQDIDPVFSLLKSRYSSLSSPISEYFDTLDPNLHVLYKKRKDFEDSLTLINDHVSDIIDKEQEKAQDVFPHYFEKYRTDGLEYNAYIGQSLVQNLEYSPIYLKNLRLWQLLVKVQVARKIRSLQKQLAIKLDITQLILVHSNPLSIAFRQDEKKFDVDGAYNIRYEITKKRIDKAQIKGTTERVTQVGKIAIIYSHYDEISEYKRYIDYMISQKLVTNNIEDLELEDLKGASGLKALRIEVDYSDLSFSMPDQSVIEDVVQNS